MSNRLNSVFFWAGISLFASLKVLKNPTVKWDILLKTWYLAPNVALLAVPRQ